MPHLIRPGEKTDALSQMTGISVFLPRTIPSVISLPMSSSPSLHRGLKNPQNVITRRPDRRTLNIPVRTEILNIAKSIPEADLHKLPTDLAANHDDCFSMMLMRKRKITQVLTTDRHFEQESFDVLIIAPSIRQ